MPAMYGFHQPGFGQSMPNLQSNQDFRLGSRFAGLTKRTVSPQGYTDVYGGLSGEDEKQIALAPWQYKQGVFDKTFPLLQNMLGGMGGTGDASFSKVGGENTPLPTLPSSFVYTPDQIQQQVNAARAQADTAAGTQHGQTAGEMASRGFSARSPIAMALNLGIDTNNQRQKADSEREIRFDAAGANAKQALGVGQLAQAQWQGFNEADIARRKSQLDAVLGYQRNMQALISALGGFGG